MTSGDQSGHFFASSGAWLLRLRTLPLIGFLLTLVSGAALLALAALLLVAGRNRVRPQKAHKSAGDMTRTQSVR